MRRLRLLLFLVCLSSLLMAQIDRASLNGTVTDTSGASVPKAQVEVVSTTSGLKRRSKPEMPEFTALPAC